MTTTSKKKTLAAITSCLVATLGLATPVYAHDDLGCMGDDCTISRAQYGIPPREIPIIETTDLTQSPSSICPTVILKTFDNRFFSVSTPRGWGRTEKEKILEQFNQEIGSKETLTIEDLKNFFQRPTVTIGHITPGVMRNDRDQGVTIQLDNGQSVTFTGLTTTLDEHRPVDVTFTNNNSNMPMQVTAITDDIFNKYAEEYIKNRDEQALDRLMYAGYQWIVFFDGGSNNLWSTKVSFTYSDTHEPLPASTIGYTSIWSPRVVTLGDSFTTLLTQPHRTSTLDKNTIHYTPTYDSVGDVVNSDYVGAFWKGNTFTFTAPGKKNDNISGYTFNTIPISIPIQCNTPSEEENNTPINPETNESTDQDVAESTSPDKEKPETTVPSTPDSEKTETNEPDQHLDIASGETENTEVSVTPESTTAAPQEDTQPAATSQSSNDRLPHTGASTGILALLAGGAVSLGIILTLIVRKQHKQNN